MKAKLLIYSRSLVNDYRWIYADALLKQVDKACIVDDFGRFEDDKDSYLNENHLIVRHVQNGIALYCFFKTLNTDQNSRRILALIGFMFSEFDYEVVQALLKYVVSYFLIESRKLERYYSNISEAADNISETIEFNLDAILNEYSKSADMCIHASRLSQFIREYPNSSFIITTKGIDAISMDDKEQEAQYDNFKRIDSILSEADENEKHAAMHMCSNESKLSPIAAFVNIVKQRLDGNK